MSRQEEFDKQSSVTRNEIREAEKRLDKREDQLERKLETLGIKERNIEKGEAGVRERQAEIEKKNKESDELLVKRRNELLRVAQLSMDDAKKQLFTRLEHDLEHECAQIIDKRISEAQDEAENARGSSSRPSSATPPGIRPRRRSARLTSLPMR